MFFLLFFFRKVKCVIYLSDLSGCKIHNVNVHAGNIYLFMTTYSPFNLENIQLQFVILHLIKSAFNTQLSGKCLLRFCYSRFFFLLI